MFSSIQCNLSYIRPSAGYMGIISFLFAFFPPSFDMFRKLEVQKGQSDLLNVVKPDRVCTFE